MGTTDASWTELSPRAREIVDAAREMLETDGGEGLSTRRLAERLGIRAPSLYSHFANKQELEMALISDGLEELADMLEAAMEGSDDPVIDLMMAYRSFAKAHPHLFRLMYSQSWDRTQLVPDAEMRTRRVAWIAVNADIVGARAIWAFAYGMAELELADRFPEGGPEAEVIWRAGLEALKAALPMSPPADTLPPR